MSKKEDFNQLVALYAKLDELQKRRKALDIKQLIHENLEDFPDTPEGLPAFNEAMSAMAAANTVDRIPTKENMRRLYYALDGVISFKEKSK